MRAIATAVAAALGVFLSAGAAGADPPTKARMLQGELVTAYEPCETPDAMTDGGFPACTSMRSDPVCGFGPNGKGKFKLRIGSVGLPRVTGRIRGLDPGCAGATLYFETSLRVTGDNCQGSACTVVDVATLLARCVVDAGLGCELAPIAPFFEPPPPPPAGEWAVLGARVVRDGTRVFDAGFLLAVP